MGAKIKTQKNPWGLLGTQKIPGPKNLPPKSHAEFSSFKNFQKGLTHKSQAKDIKNSLQQRGIPVRIKPVINTMDEKSVE